MKKKKLIIVGITLAAVVTIGVSGYFIGKYYLVNYAFNKYVLNSTLDMMQKGSDDVKENDKGTKEETAAKEQNEQSSGDAAPDVQASEKAAGKKANKSKPVDEMSNSEVAAIVSRTPSLINKLEGIVSYGDKQHVINILMSNFTQEEIAQYSKKVAGGLTSADKNELISIARSRMTSAQWSECMQLFYKYVDQLKPYIDETMLN